MASPCTQTGFSFPVTGLTIHCPVLRPLTAILEAGGIIPGKLAGFELSISTLSWPIDIEWEGVRPSDIIEQSPDRSYAVQI